MNLLYLLQFKSFIIRSNFIIKGRLNALNIVACWFHICTYIHRYIYVFTISLFIYLFRFFFFWGENKNSYYLCFISCRVLLYFFPSFLHSPSYIIEEYRVQMTSLKVKWKLSTTIYTVFGIYNDGTCKTKGFSRHFAIISVGGNRNKIITHTITIFIKWF